MTLTIREVAFQQGYVAAGHVTDAGMEFLRLVVDILGDDPEYRLMPAGRAIAWYLVDVLGMDGQADVADEVRSTLLAHPE